MDINNTQKKIIVIVIIFILSMLLYPPYHVVNNRATINAGYSFITSPPNKYATIDTSMLITQWIAVLFTGILLFVLNNNKIFKKNINIDNFTFGEQANILHKENNKYSDFSNDFDYKKKLIILFFIISVPLFAFIGKNYGDPITYIKNVIYNFKYYVRLKNHQIDSLQMSILTPGKFTDNTPPIPENLKNTFYFIKNMEFKSEYIVITCVKIVHTDGLRFNVSAAVDDVIDSVLKFDGISNGLHSKRNITKFDMNGIYYEVEYSENNIQKKIIGMILSKGENTWHVSIIFQKYFNNIAEKILNSLIIYNTKPT